MNSANIDLPPLQPASDAPLSRFRLALSDLAAGIGAIHVWPMLGWQELVQRYRRSVLGPFWLTLSTGILVGAMGPLYGRLFDLDIRSYFPYLAISFVVWSWMAQAINESCTGFITAESYIKQVKLPLSVHMLRVMWKNLVVFLHNIVVVAAVMLYARPPLDAGILLVPLAVALLAANTFTWGMLLGVVCARFRDVPLIIGNFVQLCFFLSPVMWQPGMLGRHIWAAEINPFYHFLEIVRAPLLGYRTNVTSWGAALLITVVGIALMLAVYSRFRARIAYWV